MEDAAQVFANHAQCQQLGTAQKQHHHHDGWVAAHYLSKHQCVEKDIHHVAECKQRRDQSQNGSDAQRRGGVRRDPLNRQPEQPPEVKRRLALQPVTLFEENLPLLESYPAIHAFGVTLRLAELLEGLDTFAVQQPEVAHVLQHVDVRHLLQHGVVHHRQQPSQPRLLAAVGPSCIHVLIARFPLLQHRGHHRGRMLQVGIHDHHAVALGVVEARQHGRLLAEVTRQRYIAESAVSLVHVLEHVQRMVLTAVVHQQNLPAISAVLLHHVGQCLFQSRQRGLLVITRNENRYFLHNHAYKVRISVSAR